MYPSFGTLVPHAFQFAYNFNSAITFFILYNTLDVPLSVTSVVTFLVSSRGWSFLRVMFSQTRNFTVIAFTGWTYCIEIFFSLTWKTEFAVKFSTVLNIFFTIQDFWATCSCLENRVCPEFTVLNIHFLSIRIFEQLALALKNTSCSEMFHCIEIFLSFRIFEQLALALKAGLALNSLYWIYIFYHSGFLSRLGLPWKQSLPWNVSLYWNIFIIQDFWATCACPESRTCIEFTVLNIYFLSFRIFE